MNYEEKYKEAMERAKKFEEKYGGGYAGYIFPELSESEDERIRKELKEAFEVYDIDSTWNGIPIRSILAWLEEQKPAENGKELLYVSNKSYKIGYRDGKRDAEQKQKGGKK